MNSWPHAGHFTLVGADDEVTAQPINPAVNITARMKLAMDLMCVLLVAGIAELLLAQCLIYLLKYIGTHRFVKENTRETSALRVLIVLGYSAGAID